MCGFPVHSDGWATISLRFDNDVQEGDGPILLVALHCKPDDRVNTVNVLKEALFDADFSFCWNRTSGWIVDKLSTTAVAFFRSERILKYKHLYGA